LAREIYSATNVAEPQQIDFPDNIIRIIAYVVSNCGSR